MIIDFHTHMKLTKKVAFSLEYFRKSIEEAKESGLTALTLTEHFNTYRFGDMYDALDQEYAYHGDCYDVDGFKVFTGMEIDVKEGGHILFVGNRQAIRDIRRQLDGHETEDRFIGLETLFRIGEPYDLLKTGAHPFRESNPLHHVAAELLMQFDCFDLNGKDMYKYGVDTMREQVLKFGSQLGVPVVGGSDTHHPMQFGCVVNHLDEACTTVAELKRSVQQGRYRIDISPCLATKVKAANTIKKMLKANLEPGAVVS
ncbi:PHP domain-containing protein [Paenibacillus rigui]|uniref:Histidinol-phosphatase n=1 Tax=Paenibacillus rigui TaxID=554312 RepID=A0A229UMX5_9BACL|nr:PHP-associated domain-containing protein [Paenibacillus rigui]OXM84847.1 histidinol-phosphatase [Paenibacillus rigui]